ncbi:hypothetical protein CRENBAI_023400 [Crenichthys baileyi]|uniref:Uncharacterized protein n=1 Tax=Crenichthys baileyi TaxID=28760 RepID=A0AAV9RHW6_9TELE
MPAGAARSDDYYEYGHSGESYDSYGQEEWANSRRKGSAGRKNQRGARISQPPILNFLRAGHPSPRAFQLKLRSQLNTTVGPNMLLLFKD